MKPGLVLRWAGIIVLGLFLASCGKKTPPIPPQAVIPMAIADLSYQLDDRGVTLFWSPPVQSEQGNRLPKIESFLVEKAGYELVGFCKNCPVRYTETMEIAGEYGTEDWGETVTYRDENLKRGHVYYYRVKTKLGWREISRPSEPVSFEWPPEVRMETGEKSTGFPAD